MSGLPVSRRGTVACLEDASFEDEYFGYNFCKNPSEKIGKSLMKRVFHRAKREGISPIEWVEEHEQFYLKRLNREITALEQLKAEAISSWNGFDYAHACDSLGLEPEFRDLYEQGLAERLHLERQNQEASLMELTSNNNARLHTLNYSGFYKEGTVLKEKDFRADVDEKKRLLMKYFPKRFGNDGKQPIADMEDAKVGYLFQKLIGECKKSSP
ncbi:MAG: hypothetical protein AABW47_03515 [Nanoarchaeota archaeon]